MNFANALKQLNPLMNRDEKIALMGLANTRHYDLMRELITLLHRKYFVK